MIKARKKISLALVLIALFVSYNLDLECFLANDSGCIVSCQDGGEDLCSEPSFSSPPGVAVLVRQFQIEPLTTSSLTKDSWQDERDHVVIEPRLKIPIGLRAPPIA